MKFFLRKTALFLLKAISLLLLLYLLIWNFDFTTSNPKFKFLKEHNKNKKFEICFYGDSKNMWNFNYEILKTKFNSTYNFSLAGASYEDIIEFYDLNFCNCEINILNLSEITFSDKRIKNKFSYLLNSKMFVSPLNLKNFRTDVNNIIYSYKNSNIKNGFYNLRGNFLKLKTSNKVPIIDKQKAYNIINSLKKRLDGKKIIFIIHPDREERKIFLENYKDFLRNLYIKNLRGYPLIDLSNFEALQKPELYYDSYHLNTVGSKILTNIFLERLDSIEFDKINPKL